MAVLGSGDDAGKRPLDARLETAVPRSADPYLSFLPPGVVTDYRYWTAKIRFDSWDRAAAAPRTRAGGASVTETEDNDDFADADPLPGLVAGGEALEAGDVIGVVSDLVAELSIVGPDFRERFGSSWAREVRGSSRCSWAGRGAPATEDPPRLG